MRPIQTRAPRPARPHRVARRPLSPGTLIALHLLLAPSLVAQTVHGTLTDRATGHPVSGAMAVLLGDGGSAVASTLTGEQGRFVLQAPAPGRYRVRAERIGYRSQTGPVFTLSAGEQHTHELEVDAQAISLEGITARGDRRCRVRPEQGLATAQVWEEARKALSTTAWVQRESLLRYQLDLFERTLDAERLRVVEERLQRKSGYQAQPFVSLAVEELTERGFMHEVDGGAHYDYYAPDAEVLLSDAFLDTHCLRLVEGEGEREDQVGLAFEPVRGRTVPEIEGTLWMDQRSALLEELEYRYVNLPWPIPTGQVGGRIQFALLPSGALVVRRWSIRMPVLALAEHRWRGSSRREVQIQGYREGGGEVTRVRTAAGAVLELAERAVLAGEVFDSTRSSALPGARVSLVGTPYAALTDDRGRFRIPDLPEGSYAIAFSHPRLDSLPLVPAPAAEVSLRTGQVSSVALSVPPLQRLLREACPEQAPGRISDGTVPGIAAGEQMGVAHGVVRDSAGLPVPGAAVRLSWNRWEIDFQRRESAGSSPGASRGHRSSRGTLTTVEEEPWNAETIADGEGRYIVCGLPVGIPIRASAHAGEAESDEITFQLRAEPVHTQNLVLGGAPRG